MEKEELEKIIKGLQENEESAVKILNKCTELFKRNEENERRLKEASMLVRKYTYSITNYKEKTKITKVELEDEKLQELMDLLEAPHEGNTRKTNK